MRYYRKREIRHRQCNTYLPRGASNEKLRSSEFAERLNVHHLFRRNPHLRKPKNEAAPTMYNSLSVVADVMPILGVEIKPKYDDIKPLLPS